MARQFSEGNNCCNNNPPSLSALTQKKFILTHIKYSIGVSDQLEPSLWAFICHS